MDLFLRVVFSTGLVLGAIWWAARAVRQPGALMARFKLTSATPLVESRSSLSRSTVLAVVRFDDRRLLVAANDQRIELIASSDAITAPEQAVATAAHPETPTSVDPVTDAQLAAIRDSLKPSTFLDVLRAHTVRTDVPQR